jgi:hypothetical protein
LVGQAPAELEREENATSLKNEWGKTAGKYEKELQEPVHGPG